MTKQIQETELICYKKLPIWNKDTLPKIFQQKHNTKSGTWAKLTILKGTLKYYSLDENENVLETIIFDTKNQRPLVEPQAWHKVEPLSDDLECYLEFYCKKEEYFHKKYNISKTHSEVIELYNLIKNNNKSDKIKNILDLGCGNGRNSLFLNSKEFNITSLDRNEDSIFNLNNIINQEHLSNIKTKTYDINSANIIESYDTVISTVVFMFLNPDKIDTIIENIQQKTNLNGYNLFVVAMDTEQFPCVMPFSSPFKENQLKNYYDNENWEIIKYNENPGELHKTDGYGNRIKLQFATIVAKKLN